MVEAAHAQPAWVLLAYLIAGICFILALRGLSGPESSRRGNYTGMVGMAIAVLTTLVTHVPGLDLSNGNPFGPHYSRPILDWSVLGQIVAAMLIGGGIGLITAR